MTETTPDSLSTNEDAPRELSRGSRLFVAAILLLVIGLPVLMLFFNPSRGGLINPRQGKLTALQLEPLTGDEDQIVTLEDLNGQVVLVHFWGTWCPPCVEEFPHIAALYEGFKNRRDFRLLAVSCRAEETSLKYLREKTQAFLDEQPASLPTYADFDVTTRQAMHEVDSFQGEYPTTVLLDRQHYVRKVWRGPNPNYPRQMQQAVQMLLNESRTDG